MKDIATISVASISSHCLMTSQAVECLFMKAWEESTLMHRHAAAVADLVMKI